jgi:hypothetical protein
MLSRSALFLKGQKITAMREYRLFE